MSKSRAFCLTLNNYSYMEWKLFQTHVQDGIENGSVVYAICGKEVGESGTPHLQSYIYYKNAKQVNAANLAKMKRAWGSDRYHVEVAKGSPTENDKYCSKEGDFERHGVLPVSQNDRWKESVELLRGGGTVLDVVEAQPQIGITCFRTLKELRNEFATARSSNEKTALFWFYGPPGSGKSMYARGIDPDYYKKPHGQWWTEDYHQQDVVIMDDYRPTKEFPLEELLNLADYGKHNVPIKGGFRVFNSKMIVITTPLPPRETFSHLDWLKEENMQQVIRRITYQCAFPLTALDAVCLPTEIKRVLASAVPGDLPTTHVVETDVLEVEN